MPYLVFQLFQTYLIRTNASKQRYASGTSSNPAGPTVWKVLILDNRSKDVLATVLRVQDLRDAGVTLHV